MSEIKRVKRMSKEKYVHMGNRHGQSRSKTQEGPSSDKNTDNGGTDTGDTKGTVITTIERASGRGTRGRTGG